MHNPLMGPQCIVTARSVLVQIKELKFAALAKIENHAKWITIIKLTIFRYFF